MSASLHGVDSSLCRHFGGVPVRASVSFVGVDPIDVLRFEPIPGERAYVTLGMSRHPMTAADSAFTATDGPRAELLLHLRDPNDVRADCWRKLALLAAAPAVEGVVYSPGMTIDLGEPFSSGSWCTGAVIAESPLEVIDTEAGPVAVLQALPATHSELAWCRVRGAAELRERWRAQGTDLLDLARRAAELGD